MSDKRAGRLDCQQFGQLVHELLDQRKALAEEPELQQHAADCSDCRQLLQTYEWLFVDQPLGLAADQQVGVRREEPRKSARHFALALSTAALFLLSLGLSSNWQPADQPLATIPTAGEDSVKSAMVSPGLVGGPLSEIGLADNAVTSLPATYRSRAELLGYSWGMADSFYQSDRFWPDQLQLTTPAESIQGLSRSLDPILSSPYFQYSAELPAVRELRNSVTVTLDLLSRPFAKPPQAEPDLGQYLAGIDLIALG